MLIGVMDSGIGGLTTLAEIIRVRGGGSYVYFSDDAHCPYGNKSKDEIYLTVKSGAERLMREGAECIVLACNTATACAIDELRAKFKSFTFVGTEPCINTAKIYGKKLCVLATPATLSSSRFLRLSQGAECTFPRCNLLAAEIEKSFPSFLSAKQLLTQILAPYRGTRFDAAVLGCTHYCLLKRHIEKLLACPVKDGNNGVARRLRRLTGADSSPVSVELISSSGNICTLRAAANAILRQAVQAVSMSGEGGATLF